MLANQYKNMLLRVSVISFMCIFTYELNTRKSQMGTLPTNLVAQKYFLTEHNPEKALLVLEKSISQNPDNAEGWFLLGRIYFVQNQLNKSEQAYLKSISLDPKNEQSYYGLGLTYGYLNNLKAAEHNFQRYLEMIEEKKASGEYFAYPSGHWAGYNDLAWVYFLQGNFTEAEKVAREALSKYNNPWLLNMLGAVLLNQGRNEEAKAYFEQAKLYTESMSVEDFGEAYSGDNKEWHQKGFANMREIIQENIRKAESSK